jgi:hypothetical protein
MTKINTIDRVPVEAIDTLPLFAPPGWRSLGPITAEVAENDTDPLDFSIERPVRLALITCAVCGAAARIPFLADGKLCDLCRMDLALAEANVRYALGKAEEKRAQTWENWTATHEAATPADQDRYSAAREARRTGMVKGKPVAPAAIDRMWTEARAKGDGLSVLIEAHDACVAADLVLNRARYQAGVALAEIEAARKEGTS